jgi:cytochrome c-type biogenesis protein CcmH/NrfF
MPADGGLFDGFMWSVWMWGAAVLLVIIAGVIIALVIRKKRRNNKDLFEEA